MTYHIFDIITEINESRILTNHLSCKCECKFDCRKCNPNQKWNNDECQCECENPKEYNACKKNYVWNPDTSSCEKGKYLGSIIVDSAVTYNETKEMELFQQKILQQISMFYSPFY